MSQALEPELERLVALARDARSRAYAPYSKFLVGAAVESKSGAVFSGGNVENSSYGATICAERSAIVQMVAAGERELCRVAVYTEAAALAMPCGICRQVMSEFGREVTLVTAGPAGFRVLALSDLLPEPFRLLP